MLTFRFHLDDRCTSRRVRACGARSSLLSLSTFALIVVCIPTSAVSVSAAEFSTENFRVCATETGLARDIGLRAEELRTAAAIEWLGRELEPWTERCRVFVDPESPRLTGDTSYVLLHGEVRRWRMELRGEPQRILDVLLPHEVVHTVLASHFRRPIPRWADEGAALSAEGRHERDRLWKLESPWLTAGDCAPLRALFDAQEYPVGRDEVRRFYVQGGSLTDFLLSAGKPEFLSFVTTGIQDGWEAAVRKHYGFSSIDGLEDAWRVWIAQDRPQVIIPPQELLMSAWHEATAVLEPVGAAIIDTDGRLAVRNTVIATPSGGAQ